MIKNTELTKFSFFVTAHYESQKDWSTRLMIEQSFALKCPSVAHQLSGFKKIQQELSRPEVLERYVQYSNSNINSNITSSWI